MALSGRFSASSMMISLPESFSRAIVMFFIVLIDAGYSPSFFMISANTSFAV
jgi:hypothetical protein